LVAGRERPNVAESIDIRDGRYAANEAAYRRVNEHIRGYKERADRPDPMTFMCECAEGGCIDPISVSLDEYRAVRRHPRRFLVAPDHDAPELERIVERRADYWVVEKAVDPEASATETMYPCVGSGGPPSHVAHVAPPEQERAITGVCPQCGHEVALDDHGLLPWHSRQVDPADE